MSLIKKVLPVLIFLLIVAVAWVGFSIYYQTVEIDVNPNATNFTKPINKSFNEEALEEVVSRTDESFPVSPQEFLKFNQED
jgi:cell division protein FtsL